MFAAAAYLMAGFFNEAIEVDAKKKPKDVSWKACGKMMKSPDDLLKRMLDHKDIVDANLIPASNVKWIKDKYMSEECFTPEIMAGKSAAAKGVCDWVINMVKYWDVIQDVEPKRKALAEANEMLAEANITAAEVKEKVDGLNAKLATLNAEFKKANDEKNAAVAEATRCANRLNLATRLVTALGSEKVRWSNSII